MSGDAGPSPLKSGNDCDSAGNTDLGVTNEFQQVRKFAKFANTASVNNEDRL